MPDAPTPWEHQRALEQLRTDFGLGMAQLNTRLDRLVSNDAFLAEQRRVDDKFKDVAKSIDAEATARKEGDHRQQVALDKLVANQKWLIVAVILPVVLFIANIVLRSQ